MTTKRSYRSWGGVPGSLPQRVERTTWMQHVSLEAGEFSLPIGLQRSYGDSALCNGGVLVDMTGLDRLHSFDATTGVLRADAGVTIGSLYSLIVPRGWFVPVVPGTQFVTLGGAVANDIHGKNHHRVGTFGRFVRAFYLRRSDGDAMVTEATHPELFRATIGGLGLTGVITWVEIQCVPIPSSTLDVVDTRCDTVAGVIGAFRETDAESEFSVAWVDTLHKKQRGVVSKGNWSSSTAEFVEHKPIATVPRLLPNGIVGRWSIGIFNRLWYLQHGLRAARKKAALTSFFHPLDAVGNWNLLYGNRGMLQYQCVIPESQGTHPAFEVLSAFKNSGLASLLTVVKRFGSVVSPGMLSFPMPGVTIALDVPNTGRDVLDVLARCDAIVLEAGGRIYPAKDSRVAPSAFRQMYPMVESFTAWKDPQIRSTFWQRVMEE